MDSYLTENFNSQQLIPLKLIDENKFLWALGTIFGNSASQVGLGPDGIKPSYYLYNNIAAIRYTSNQHLEYPVIKIKNKTIYTEHGKFKKAT